MIEGVKETHKIDNFGLKVCPLGPRGELHMRPQWDLKAGEARWDLEVSRTDLEASRNRTSRGATWDLGGRRTDLGGSRTDLEGTHNDRKRAIPHPITIQTIHTLRPKFSHLIFVKKISDHSFLGQKTRNSRHMLIRNESAQMVENGMTNEPRRSYCFSLF